MPDPDSFAARRRADYDAVVADPDAPFVEARPPLFSSAVAVQDQADGKGALHQWAAMYLPSEYSDWVEEARAHVESCYLGDWSALAKVELRGPQAHAFLDWLGVADLSSMRTGQVKHHVQLDDEGWIASEGVICRLGDERFLYTAGSTEWLQWQLGAGAWDVELSDVNPDTFVFGVQGPRSLAVLEQVTGESLRDLDFARARTTRIAGVEVRILRTGISGELGYELHGPARAGGEVWAAVRDGGADLGLRQLGGRAQSVQHIEAGIATNGLDYFPSAARTPGAPRLFRRRAVGGSFVPTGGFVDYFRRPDELGWLYNGIPEHDFQGRDALVAIEAAGGSPRTLVGLTWDAGDVSDVFASLFGYGPIADQMDVPRRLGPAFDQVLVGGEPAGVSTGRTISPNVRATISLCVIDREHARAGTDVTVVWGRPGTPQREIRARVATLPFKPDRRRTDVRTL